MDALINSRAKGATFERSLANYLKGRGWNARRGQQFSGLSPLGETQPDVLVLDKDFPLHIEAKAVERLNVHAAMEQAVNDCPENLMPSVWLKKNRSGVLVTLRADDLMSLIEKSRTK